MKTPIQNPWFVVSGSVSDADRRLFCFPYGGAGASAFRPWSRTLAQRWQLCAVVLPGREGRFREARYEAVGPLTDALINEIAPLLDRPFAFFGHSVGALIAFELARRLRRQDLPMPDRFFMSGRAAPQTPRRGTDYHLRTGAALVAALETIGEGSGRPVPDPAMISAMEPLLRSDFAITETYVYAEDLPFEQPLTAFGARNDPTVDIEDIAAWRLQTSTDFSLYLFEDGGHFFIDRHYNAIINHIAEEW